MIERSPLWPASPPPDFTFSAADGQVELVVHDHDLLGLDAVAARQRGDREPGVVHVRERDRERDALPADAHLVGAGALLALAQRRAVALREQLDDLGADVVARARVLVAGIAEPDDEQVGGRARARRATRPPQSHDGYSPPSPPSDDASALGLGALGGLALFALDAFALDFLLDHDARRRDLRDEVVGLELRGDAGGERDVGDAELVADGELRHVDLDRRPGCCRAWPRR